MAGCPRGLNRPQGQNRFARFNAEHTPKKSGLRPIPSHCVHRSSSGDTPLRVTENARQRNELRSLEEVFVSHQ